MDRKSKQLVKQLESESAKERYIAVVTLGRLRDTRLIPVLDKVATFDDNAKVRHVAHQAVKFLKILKEEEVRKARQAQQQAMDDDEGEQEAVPMEIDWGDLFEAEGQPEPEPIESYHPQYTMIADDSEPAPSGKRRKKEKKRRKGWSCIRFLIFIAFVTTAVGVARLAIDNPWDEDPSSREEAIEWLQEWLDEMVVTTNAYAIALSSDEFDCAAYRDDEYMEVPERPSWAGTDHDYQEDLGAFFEHMDQAERNLKKVRSDIDNPCEQVEESFRWPPNQNPKSLVDSVMENHLRPAQLILDDPERLTKETVGLLEDWLGDLSITLNTYNQTFSAAEIDCAAYQSNSALDIPERPAGIEDDTDQDALNEFLSYIQEVESRLTEARQYIDNVCQDAGGVQPWPAGGNPKSLIDDTIRNYFAPAQRIVAEERQRVGN